MNEDTTRFQAGPKREFRVSTPGDWIIVDADAILSWNGNSGVYPPELQSATQYIRNAAQIFSESGVLFAAFLIEPGNADALATMSTCFVGLGADSSRSGLEDLVRANPPPDALQGTFAVEASQTETAIVVRAESLRRSVLEVPSKETVSLSVEYFQTVPGDDGLLVTAFSTPNVRLIDSYRELFGSIAATIDFG